MAISIEQLTAAYEREQRENRPLRTADDLPLSYETITPDWLTSVLCRGHSLAPPRDLARHAALCRTPSELAPHPEP